jgi:hypothetical protein
MKRLRALVRRVLALWRTEKHKDGGEESEEDAAIQDRAW